LMAKLPAFAKAFVGRWRIVEMDVWDKDFLDLVETAHLTFKGAADGEIAFGALKSFLDVRYGTRDGSACAEFSWEGNDENDPASGRGWVVLGTAGRLVGHFYIHNATIQASYAIVPDFFNGLLGARRLARRWVPAFDAASEENGPHRTRLGFSYAKQMAGGSWVGYLLSWRATKINALQR
jgi:hypothetical protein